MKRITWFDQIIGYGLVLLIVVSCAATPAHAPTPTAVAPTMTIPPPSPQPTATSVAPTETSALPAPTEAPAAAAVAAAHTPLPPPISPEFPTGRFFHDHGVGGYCVIEFNEDGTHAYYLGTTSIDVTGKTPWIHGTYVVEGNLYTATSETVLAGYPACDSLAAYAWTYDGQTLLFQAVGEDRCANRKRIYETQHKWKRAE